MNKGEMLRPQGPIGVFDSGVGGLSVVKEIWEELPHEDILYIADQAHTPYGSRGMEQIRQFSEGITRYLLEQGAKLIVVACNTASAASLSYLRGGLQYGVGGILELPASGLLSHPVCGNGTGCQTGG
jgi:glutamate racemase